MSDNNEFLNKFKNQIIKKKSEEINNQNTENNKKLNKFITKKKNEENENSLEQYSLNEEKETNNNNNLNFNSNTKVVDIINDKNIIMSKPETYNKITEERNTGNKQKK